MLKRFALALRHCKAQATAYGECVQRDLPEVGLKGWGLGSRGRQVRPSRAQVKLQGCQAEFDKLRVCFMSQVRGAGR